MRGKRLSPRLAAMADYISTGEVVADIGADHGYLPLSLLLEGRSPFAILTDLRKGPLEKTRVSVEKACRADDTLAARIELRLGDGLAALAPGEVDTIVIAGMGGEVIASILAADSVKTGSFSKYILQPRTKTALLRNWIAENGFCFLAETTAEERGRNADIIVCAPKEREHKCGSSGVSALWRDARAPAPDFSSLACKFCRLCKNSLRSNIAKPMAKSLLTLTEKSRCIAIAPRHKALTPLLPHPHPTWDFEWR